MGKYILAVLSPLVCVHLAWHSQETNTGIIFAVKTIFSLASDLLKGFSIFISFEKLQKALTVMPALTFSVRANTVT